MKIGNKNDTRQKRHIRVRKKVNGTAERPRLNIYRSTNHIYAQVIDDVAGHTLVAASSQDKALGLTSGGNLPAGRVAKLAAAAREGGLNF
jgi:large subunit ribosomal protein L18